MMATLSVAVRKLHTPVCCVSACCSSLRRNKHKGALTCWPCQWLMGARKEMETCERGAALKSWKRGVRDNRRASELSCGCCGCAKLLHLPVMEPLLAGRSCSEKSDLEQSGAMRLRDSSAVEDAWLPEVGALVVEALGASDCASSSELC